MCSLDSLDGQWLGPIVDHMCNLLVHYAEAADTEAHVELNEEKKLNSSDSVPPAATDGEKE